MKGQLSLEALIVFAIGICIIALIFPAISSIKNSSDYIQQTVNKKLVLEKIASTCEEVLITNSEKKVQVFSLSSWNITGIEKEITNVCSVVKEVELKAGQNILTISPSNTKADVFG